MTQERAISSPHPVWWTEEHDSNWERAKHALQRDWEQTKGDLADSGVDLNQGAMDTIRQAIGAQAIPVDGLPNPGPRHDWTFIEPAVRYGYAARQHFGNDEWNESLAARLRADWEGSGQPGSWQSMQHGVRTGWRSFQRAG